MKQGKLKEISISADFYMIEFIKKNIHTKPGSVINRNLYDRLIPIHIACSQIDSALDKYNFDRDYLLYQ